MFGKSRDKILNLFLNSFIEIYAKVGLSTEIVYNK